MKNYRFETIERRIPGTAVDALTFVNGQVGAAHRKEAVLASLEIVQWDDLAGFQVYLKFRYEVAAA
jgi:hypothetical protein